MNMYLTFVITKFRIKRSNSPTQGGRAGEYEAAKPGGEGGTGRGWERRGEEARRFATSNSYDGHPQGSFDARKHDKVMSHRCLDQSFVKSERSGAVHGSNVERS